MPWAPPRGTQSNKSTCKNTENVVPKRLAYDSSLLAASSVATIIGSASSMLLESNGAALMVVLLRSRRDLPISMSPSLSRVPRVNARIARLGKRLACESPLVGGSYIAKLFVAFSSISLEPISARRSWPSSCACIEAPSSSCPRLHDSVL